MSKRLTILSVSLLAVLLLVCAAWSGRYVLWLLGCTAILWLLLSGMIWASGIRPSGVARSASPLSPAGECVEIEMRLQLRGWLPLTWIVVEDSWHRKLLLPGLSRTVSYRYTTPALVRGCYDSTGVSIIYGDMLGLGKRQVQLADPMQLVAYPLPDAAAGSWVHRGASPEGWPDYRRYRDGDPLHGLNWKLSAQRDEWMVREQTLPVADRLLVLLLDRCTSEAEWEHALQVASGWVLYGQHDAGSWLGVPDETVGNQWYALDGEHARLAALRALANAAIGHDPDECRRGIAEAMQRWPLAACGLIRAGQIRIRSAGMERGQDDDRRSG